MNFSGKGSYHKESERLALTASYGSSQRSACKLRSSSLELIAALGPNLILAVLKTGPIPFLITNNSRSVVDFVTLALSRDVRCPAQPKGCCRVQEAVTGSPSSKSQSLAGVSARLQHRGSSMRRPRRQVLHGLLVAVLPRTTTNKRVSPAIAVSALDLGQRYVRVSQTTSWSSTVMWFMILLFLSASASWRHAGRDAPPPGSLLLALGFFKRWVLFCLHGLETGLDEVLKDPGCRGPYQKSHR